MSAERLRIGIVYDALYPAMTGGAELRNHELARRLAERHEVHLVTWQFWDGPALMERDGIVHHGIGRPPAFYGADGKRTVREAAAFAARLLPALARLRLDVVDCSATPYLPLYAAWLATRISRTPLVTTWHEYWGSHWSAYLPQRPMVARAARLLEAGARRLGDRLVAVSPFTAERLALSHERGLTVVGNGVDLDDIRRARRHRAPSDLVFVGRLIDEKRVDLLLEAVALLADRFPELRCDIVGDGPERAGLERLAARLGIDRHVRFHGRLPRPLVHARLKAARVLVLPSAREGYGMVVAEAQACGSVPVVARGPMSAAGALVRDGVDGLLCEPSAAGISAAVTELLLDPARRRAMAAAGRRASGGRSWESAAAAIEEVYRSALRRPALAAVTA